MIIKNLRGEVLWRADLSANLRGADLFGADLREANLRGANLFGADLREAYLGGANLFGADLREANLRGANLFGADLREANLRGANLGGANLREAYLGGANLFGADLRGADLFGADLREANLRGANLEGADLEKANLSEANGIEQTIITPDGQFDAWKSCKNNVIVRVRIPADAKRSNSTGRKCRAEYIEVLEVIGAEIGISQYDPNVTYEKGKIVKAHYWEENRWIECGGGIHFFLTRKEAEDFNL